MRRMISVAALLSFTVGVVANTEESWYPQQLVAIQYPQLAAQAQVEGVVVIDCDVGVSVASVCSPTAGPPLLTDAVMSSVADWKFAPPCGSSSRSGRFRLVVDFRLITARTTPLRDFRFVWPARAYVEARPMRHSH